MMEILAQEMSIMEMDVIGVAFLKLQHLNGPVLQLQQQQQLFVQRFVVMVSLSISTNVMMGILSLEMDAVQHVK
jgi:hypothetical protein